MFHVRPTFNSCPQRTFPWWCCTKTKRKKKNIAKWLSCKQPVSIIHPCSWFKLFSFWFKTKTSLTNNIPKIFPLIYYWRWENKTNLAGTNFVELPKEKREKNPIKFNPKENQSCENLKSTWSFVRCWIPSEIWNIVCNNCMIIIVNLRMWQLNGK